MPVKAVARIVGEHDTKVWRVIHHYVDQARARAGVTRVAIDETAARRGHDYISLFVDIDQARVLFATEGRDADTVTEFAQDLTAPRGKPEAVGEVCIDMSPLLSGSMGWICGISFSGQRLAVEYAWCRFEAGFTIWV